MLAYFVGTILFGAFVAPILFWGAHAIAAHGIFPGLGSFDFESYFHRALLLGAVVLLWPLLRSLGVKTRRDLDLEPNPRWLRDVAAGFILSAIPVVLCEIFLIQRGLYSLRGIVPTAALGQAVLSAIIVPLMEEALFRGLFLGILLRALRRWRANAVSAAIFSIVHFLKAPEQTTSDVRWFSGFVSLAHSTDQFGQPMLVLAGFTTLFVIGLILAYARLRTRSLWLPIGLHAGWILGNEAFLKITRRQVIALPWLGKNLLTGLVPLAVCFITWYLLKVWLRYASARSA